MKYTPERPEILSNQLCCYESGSYGSYLEVDGVSPTITNHLMGVTYRVLDGSGVISTPSTVWGVERGDEVTIPVCEPYSYAGRMSLLADMGSLVNAEFVTFNGDKLSRASRQKIRRVYRDAAKAVMYSDMEETLTKWVGPLESHLAFLAGMQNR